MKPVEVVVEAGGHEGGTDDEGGRRVFMGDIMNCIQIISRSLSNKLGLQ